MTLREVEKIPQRGEGSGLNAVKRSQINIRVVNGPIIWAFEGIMVWPSLMSHRNKTYIFMCSEIKQSTEHLWNWAKKGCWLPNTSSGQVLLHVRMGSGSYSYGKKWRLGTLFSCFALKKHNKTTAIRSCNAILKHVCRVPCMLDLPLVELWSCEQIAVIENLAQTFSWIIAFKNNWLMG